MLKTPKPKVIAAKAPAITELEIEVSASPAASAISTQTPSNIRGEFCAADFGSPPRLALVYSTSNAVQWLSPGQWGLTNGIGDPVGLGPAVNVIFLSARLWWLMDYGQEESGGGGAPVRFEKKQEVIDYGGQPLESFNTMREPNKPTFSRSMELNLLIEDANKADATYLRLPLSGNTYLVAVYEASRSGYRSVGVGLNATWHNRHEVPHQCQWTLGIRSQRNKRLGTTYPVPTLTRGPEVPTAIRAEIRQLIDRQLLA